MQDKKTTEGSPSCKCQAESIVLLPCSGASNCGQIANHVAVKLTEEGVGKMYCLAGIGAHIDSMVESLKSAERIVAIDGCSVACAKQVIEHTGFSVTDRICVADLGIEKLHEFTLAPQDIARVSQYTRKALAKL